MADNGSAASKKSGFFRKRRSSSKTRKEDEMKPVDIETAQGVEMELAKSGEVIERGDTPETIEALVSESPEVKTDESAEAVGTQSSGEDTSPKGVKGDGSDPEVTTKKKSKRRPRSLFKRNSKNLKDDKKVEDACVVTKESETREESPEASSSVNDTKEQVVCDEPEKRDEIRDQSDAEYDLGEASEGEALEEKSDEHDEQSEVATTADGQTGNEKKSGQKQGTKRKGFFKRGLSLRRIKSKKKQEDSEPKTVDNPTTKEIETRETGVLSDSALEQNAAPGDNEEVNNGELSSDVKENNEVESREILDGTQTEALENTTAIVKKAATKPVRKVSFVEPKFANESSDEGDSPSETETGDDLQDSTPPVAAEVAPSAEVTIVISEPVVDPKDVSADENPTTEVDDDDELTEVSSVSSSLLASSDVTSQVDTDVTEDTQLSVFADTEETGSRITLVESGEVGEGSESKPEDVSESKPEVGSSDWQSKQEDELAEKDSNLEGDKLLEDRSKEKEGEWELLNQSYDMSVELSRVRKQTLFNFKRLCCSVM